MNIDDSLKQPVQRTPHRVLIVDDDELLLDALEEHFKAIGFEVHAVTEKEEAEALLANFNYSIVITDLALTTVGYRGLDLLDCTWDLCDRPKVIVLTGHSAPEIQVEARTRGIDRFLTKPIRLGELSMIARELVGARA